MRQRQYGKVCINYRRGDDPGFTTALYHNLEREFGAGRLFMDVEGHIKPGDDFLEVIRAQVADCDVLLSVIGPRWAELIVARPVGAHDFVAMEIKAALDQGKRIIPVLVGGAAFPQAEIMPEEIRALVRKNAVDLRPERFRADCQGLILALKEAFVSVETERATKIELERQTVEEARNQREAEAKARVSEQRRAEGEAQRRAKKEGREGARWGAAFRWRPMVALVALVSAGLAIYSWPHHGALGSAISVPARPAGAQALAANECGETSFSGGFYDSGGQRVFDPDRFHAYSVTMDVPVYSADTGEDKLLRSLRFGERLTVLDPGEGKPRLKIRLDSSVSGWIDRGSALCRPTPLTNTTTGLYRRAVVRTENPVQVPTQGTTVYHSPDGRCEGSCASVSRFRWYYIFGEDEHSYLLSEAVLLGNVNTKLLGWVPKSDVYPWDTSLGLRVNEILRGSRGDDSDTRHVCLYKTLTDLWRGMNCNAIPGGLSWYDLEARMLVLAQYPDVYHVLLPNAFQDMNVPLSTLGLKNQAASVEGFIKVGDQVTPELLVTGHQISELLEALSKFKNFGNAIDGRKVRRELANVLLQALSAALNLDVDSIDMPLTAITQFQNGLTSKTRILNYTINELANPDLIPDCEIKNLVQYLMAKYIILKIVSENQGKKGVVWSQREFPPESCPTMSTKARWIPYISIEGIFPRAIRDSNHEYKYCYSRQDEEFCWLPVEYLP